MKRYIVVPAARADLDEIWLYIAQNGSVAAAERAVSTIVHVFPILATNPGIGRLRPDLGPMLRSFPVENYRIYYRQATRDHSDPSHLSCVT